MRPMKRKWRLYKKLHSKNKCPHCKALKSSTMKSGCYSNDCYDYDFVCNNCGIWLGSSSYGHVESWYYLMSAYRAYRKYIKANPNSDLAKNGFPL